jgi:hypothetical protein
MTGAGNHDSPMANPAGIGDSRAVFMRASLLGAIAKRDLSAGLALCNNMLAEDPSDSSLLTFRANIQDLLAAVPQSKSSVNSSEQSPDESSDDCTGPN